MSRIFEDDSKIKQFERIQKNLDSLMPNSADDAIQSLLAQIPGELLATKEYLMTICELFAIYARNKHKTKKRNVFKLFEGIMTQIKAQLNDESSFFWTIFGGLYYFKLWFYQLDLITIDTIIQAAKKDQNHAIAEYFLPEIIEKVPELFEKEIKYQLECPYSSEYIEEFKNLRLKYLKWICESGDYNDQVFKEIETDKLRYSILTDDLDLFQSIVSKSNFEINMKIKESLIQNSHCFYGEEPLIEFALEYGAIKITKFLIMNNAEITQGLYYSAVCSHNYEMIHLIESKIPDNFAKNTLFHSIANWSSEIIEYVLNNYEDFDFFEKEEDIENAEKESLLFEVFQYTLIYMNFEFFIEKFIPFFNNHSNYLTKRINEIFMLTFCEISGYFSREFFKIPNIDVNHFSEERNFSVLGFAIEYSNTNIIELLLNDPNLDINKYAYSVFPPLMLACGNFTDMKIIKMISKHPEIKVNMRDGRHRLNAIEICVSKGNYYTAKYLTENFKNLHVSSFGCYFYFTLKCRNLKTLELIMSYYLKTNKNKEYACIEKSVKDFSFAQDYREEYLKDLKNAYDLLTLSQNSD